MIELSISKLHLELFNLVSNIMNLIKVGNELWILLIEIDSRDLKCENIIINCISLY